MSPLIDIKNRRSQQFWLKIIMDQMHCAIVGKLNFN